MSNADIKIKFDCNGFSAPAYSCSKPGDNSGVYVQSTDYDALVEQNKALKAALEGLCCSPHTRLTKHVLLEVSQDDIDVAIKALKDNS